MASFGLRVSPTPYLEVQDNHGPKGSYWGYTWYIGVSGIYENYNPIQSHTCNLNHIRGLGSSDWVIRYKYNNTWVRVTMNIQSRGSKSGTSVNVQP